MFGIGGFELLLILVFAFLILGPDKLPEVAKTAGRAIARFRDAQQEMNDALKDSDLVDAKTGKPASNPVEMVERVAKVAADGKGEEVMQKMTSAAAAAATSVMKPHDDESAPVDAPDAEADAAADADAKDPAQMSFAERKARYERERAAREAAAAEAAPAATAADGAVADGDAVDAADAADAADAPEGGDA